MIFYAIGAIILIKLVEFYLARLERRRKRAELTKAWNDALRLYLREVNERFLWDNFTSHVAYNRMGRLEKVDSVTGRLIERN